MDTHSKKNITDEATKEKKIHHNTKLRNKSHNIEGIQNLKELFEDTMAPLYLISFGAPLA